MQPYAVVPQVRCVAAIQGTEAQNPLVWGWVETSVWTKRMLAALGNGVKGGKWFSLIDKVYDRCTLEAAWKRVAANRGAAGVDRVIASSDSKHVVTAIWRNLRRICGKVDIDLNRFGG